MGVVFKARQVGLDRCVALKRILAGPFADRQARARFRVEAEAAARLHHPNVVQIYEVGEDDGCPYLAMEYVAGVSLAERLRQGPLAPRAAAELVEALARAVQHAHERGVIHRDLKPANVLLAADGTPKVTDFGLARQVDGSERLTGSHAVLGTPSYMAPEQAEGRAPTPALDVYALGAVLFESVTGRPPFLGVTAVDTLLQVRSREPSSVRQLQPHCPRDLETVCLKCLHKDPRPRYASAGALADDLGRFLSGRPVEARPTSAAERLAKWGRRHPTVASLAAVLALGGAVSVTLITLLWLRAEGALTDREAALRDLRAETLQKEEERAKADRSRFRADLSMAGEAAAGDDLAVARRLLQRCDPALRDDDWRRLHRECHALLHEWPAFASPVMRVAARPDGAAVAVSGRAEACVFDLNDPDRPAATIPGSTFVLDMVYTAQGQVVFVTLQAGEFLKVTFWSPEKRRAERVLNFQKITSRGRVRLSPDARWLALVQDRKTEIEILDLQGGPPRTLPAGGLAAPLTLAVSEDGRWAAASDYEAVAVWDVAAGEGPFVWKSPKGLSLLPPAVGPGGAAAVFVSPKPGQVNTEILVADVPRGKLRYALTQPQLQSAAFSLDGRTLATGGVEKAVQLWDAATGEKTLTLRGGARGTASGCFSADGRRLITGGHDGVVRVWAVGSE
jgi:hypothetical protein